MPGIKGNRRTLYTKKIIKESLIELLQTNDIHQITVTSICNKANINRGTFYSYYKDSFDLLKSIEDDLFDQILSYLNETPTKDYTDSLLIKVLELISENKDLCNILLCKQKDGIIDRIIDITNKANLRNLFYKSNEFNDSHFDYLIRYSVSGILAIIQVWLRNNLKESPKEIVKIINNINKLNYSAFK